MSDTVIQVERLSKRYVISHQRGKGDGLRHVLEEAMRAPWRWLKSKSRKSEMLKSGNHFSVSASQRVSVPPAPPTREEFWALKDVSFEVQQGEVVGIIGRNGAGKSTLLKILSRITDPTEGRVRIKGRVASLLEVGTGFHPELTGRENIFLNGAILGMSRVEIKRKFDEIVAFSEIEKFLDTPVKRYSSGMYVRLAFAVAAHLEPEILVVDEVLAVGDGEFQKKCLGKMKEVSTGGRTVLFVSHQLGAVCTLCSKGLLLRAGQLAFDGKVEEAAHLYSSGGPLASQVELVSGHEGGREQTLRKVRIASNRSSGSAVIPPGAKVTVDFELSPPTPLLRPRLGAAFSTGRGERLFSIATWLGPTHLPAIKTPCIVRAEFEMPTLLPGVYSLDLGLYDEGAAIKEEYYSAVSVEVPDTKYLQSKEAVDGAIGHLLVRSRFEILPLT